MPVLVFEQVPQGGSRFVLVVVLLPLLIALMAPFWLVAVQLASDAEARAILAARPLIGVHLFIGAFVLACIFGWPLICLSNRALARRRVTIADGVVSVAGAGPFGRMRWSEPIGSYIGLTHRVRTSLSGVRHELVLLHRRPSRSVILRSAPQIRAEDVAAVARLFGLAEIPSRDAASVASRHRYFGFVKSDPLPATG